MRGKDLKFEVTVSLTLGGSGVEGVHKEREVNRR